MDRDRQLPLNFAPPQDSFAGVGPEPHSTVRHQQDVTKTADILRLPNAAERERKKESEREAALLERVLRRALHF